MKTDLSVAADGVIILGEGISLDFCWVEFHYVRPITTSLS
jgi:hypothetical protein